jgi:hypothetical protein
MNPHRTVSALVFVAFASIGYSSPAKAEWVYCSDEHKTCIPAGDLGVYKSIRFGAQDKWAIASTPDSLPCTVEVFGDPWPNATKHCEYWIEN